MPTFEERFLTFLDEDFALHPTAATSIGDHRYDDRWSDVTEAGRQARLPFIDRWLAELGAARPELTPDDTVDRDLLVRRLAVCLVAIVTRFQWNVSPVYAIFASSCDSAQFGSLKWTNERGKTNPGIDGVLIDLDARQLIPCTPGS
jgi:uncharacterized protein (DUF885 family)